MINIILKMLNDTARLLNDVKLTKMSASELVTTEWIVFGLSIASYIIIVAYTLYEVLYPLMKDEEWRKLT